MVLGSAVRTQRGGHGATEQTSLAHLPLLQPHLVLISSRTRGWLSTSAGSHLSPLECIRSFRKQVVSDVHPGREKDCPRFPTPPPPFSGFDGKAVSTKRSPASYTRSRLTSTQGRQRLYPNANSSQHGNDRFGQDPGCSDPTVLQQNLCLPNPAGKRSCPPNTRHKIALQGKTIELPVAARALCVGAAKPQSTLQSETALTFLP